MQCGVSNGGMVLTLPVGDVLFATPRSRIVRLDLQQRSFSYRAGQAAMLGMHGNGLRKPYSIASAPEEASEKGRLEFLVHVDAEGSAGPHLPTLDRHTLVDVEGPGGSFLFPERPAERRFLLIAGGTGIAPLRAMLWHALLTGLQGQFGVVYTARAPEEFAYVGELAALAAEGRIDLRQTVTRPGAPTWGGRLGRIDADYLAPMIERSATLCFVCGPSTLVQEIPAVLEQLGVTPDQIRLEQWA